MLEKELIIKTVNVSIKLITVDGKKMTKSVYNQIQYDDNILNEDFKLHKDIKVLGYVMVDSRYGSYKEIIFVRNQELRKCGISFHIEASEYDITERDNASIFSPEIVTEDNIHLRKKLPPLTKEELEIVKSRQNNLKRFLNCLLNQQLYIAI